MNSIVQRDLERIYNGLTAEERAGFAGSTLLFTGGAGFLGFYFMEFFSRFRQELGVRKVICLDNFQGDIRRGSGPSATGGGVELPGAPGLLRRGEAVWGDHVLPVPPEIPDAHHRHPAL